MEEPKEKDQNVEISAQDLLIVIIISSQLRQKMIG